MSDRLGRERGPGIELAARREHLGPRDPPRDRGLEVLAGERLALGRHELGLVGLPAREQRGREERGGLPGVGTHTERAETLVRRAQRVDRRAPASPAISSTIPVNRSVSKRP